MLYWQELYTKILVHMSILLWNETTFLPNGTAHLWMSVRSSRFCFLSIIYIVEPKAMLMSDKDIIVLTWLWMKIHVHMVVVYRSIDALRSKIDLLKVIFIYRLRVDLLVYVVGKQIWYICSDEKLYVTWSYSMIKIE